MGEFDPLDRLEELREKQENGEELTEDELQEEVDCEAKLVSNMFIEMLPEIEAEAYDRVWFDRSTIGTEAEKPGVPEDVRQKALEAQERIVAQYNIVPEECTDFYHGYWSGVLALSRLLNGYWADDIEALRDMCSLLDT